MGPYGPPCTCCTCTGTRFSSQGQEMQPMQRADCGELSSIRSAGAGAGVSGAATRSPPQPSAREALGAAHLLPDAAQATSGSVGRPTGAADGDAATWRLCVGPALHVRRTAAAVAHGLTTAQPRRRRRRPFRFCSPPPGPCSPARRRRGDHGQVAPGPRRRAAPFSARALAGCAVRTAAPSSCATRMISTRTCTRTSLRGLVAEMAARHSRRSP